MSPNDKILPITDLEPMQIRVDEKAYQFRSDGDSNGVTKAGRYHAGHWDPILHGSPILVHQRLDGSHYVADGHHRLDLAQRLHERGNGPDKIHAVVLKEADGYTVEDVRVIAAYKNMDHGHSSAVDAARVFKEAFSGRVHTELLPQLQMDKSNLKLSYSLSKLSERALDQVQAGDVPAEIAAKIAEKISGTAQQDFAMNIISGKWQQEYAAASPSFVDRLQQERQQKTGAEWSIAG